MARIKYIRVSTREQSELRQMVDAAEYDKIYIDKASGKDTKRPEFQKMMDYIREGDELVVDSYSRLARSTKDLLTIVETLDKKGVRLISQKEGLDTSTPTGKLMLTFFAALYQFQRELILEQQAEGIAACKAAGKPLGRKKIKPDDKFYAAVKKWRNGEITAVEAMRQCEMTKTVFYKLVKEYGL